MDKKKCEPMSEWYQKILAFFLWIVVWASAIFIYTNYINKSNWPQWDRYSQSFNWWPWWNLNWWEISDEQLADISVRLNISKEDLKKELDSWKTMREIMQEKWIQWRWRDWSWSWNWWGNFSWTWNSQN